MLETILAPHHPVMNALRRQIEYSRVASRQLTGVGFITTFAFPHDVTPAPVRPGTIDLGDVTATIEGVEFGAGFQLFVRDGVLRDLEGFTYVDPWPDLSVPYSVTAGGVTHGGGSLTDVEEVDAAWVRPD